MSVKSSILHYKHIIVSKLNKYRVIILLRIYKEYIGFLDYKKGKIAMKIGNPMQEYRLHACEKEPETIAWIEEYMGSGSIFYDIGANVGAYSLVCNVWTKGKAKIYAFEPSHLTFAALSENIALNNASSSIIPLNIAVSDSNKLLRIRLSNEAAGAASHEMIMNEYLKVENQDRIVIGFRLDDLFNIFNLESPNFIKLDVDGCEWQVLLGSKEVLQKEGLKSILVEIDSSSENSQKIIHLLESYGFELKRTYSHGEGTISNCIFKRMN